MPTSPRFVIPRNEMTRNLLGMMRLAVKNKSRKARRSFTAFRMTIPSVSYADTSPCLKGRLWWLVGADIIRPFCFTVSQRANAVRPYKNANSFGTYGRYVNARFVIPRNVMTRNLLGMMRLAVKNKSRKARRSFTAFRMTIPSVSYADTSPCLKGRLWWLVGADIIRPFCFTVSQQANAVRPCKNANSFGAYGRYVNARFCLYISLMHLLLNTVVLFYGIKRKVLVKMQKLL